MALTTSELESLRHHLGYGNIGAGGAPYTPDTYLELFSGVVSPNLSTATETTVVASVTAGSTVAVTPAIMTDIAPYASLVVDAGDAAEVVMVRAVTSTTFTASFAKAHSGPFPVALMCGLARLRVLLWNADAAWRGLLDISLTDQAGVKQVDEIEFFNGFGFLKGRADHYKSIVWSIAQLVQVPPKWAESGSRGGCSRLEAY